MAVAKEKKIIGENIKMGLAKGKPKRGLIIAVGIIGKRKPMLKKKGVK